MKIHESAENYLETIYILSQTHSQVRSVDIAEALNYSRPSVSVAMKNLRISGYIEMDANGFISLTNSGHEIAESMYERHQLISNWLISLGVDRTTAANDACRMEHVISEKSFEAIKTHVREIWGKEGQ